MFANRLEILDHLGRDFIEILPAEESPQRLAVPGMKAVSLWSVLLFRPLQVLLGKDVKLRRLLQFNESGR
jgi:hypothetical protein